MRPARSIWRSLLLCALPVAAAAVPAALLVEADSAWYLSLQKPAFNPPPWAYSAAWSLVYLCAAAALYPLLRGGIWPGAGTVAALAAAGALNVVWTGVFFRLHAIGAAAAVLRCCCSRLQLRCAGCGARTGPALRSSCRTCSGGSSPSRSIGRFSCKIPRELLAKRAGRLVSAGVLSYNGLQFEDHGKGAGER